MHVVNVIAKIICVTEGTRDAGCPVSTHCCDSESYKPDFFEPSFLIFRRQRFLDDGPLLNDLACLGCLESWTMRSKLA